MSSSIYSDRPVGTWKAKIYIGESEVEAYERAEAGLYGLWLLVLVGIAICAAFVKKSRSAIASSIFKVHKFWLAIVLTIIYYAFTFSYELVEQQTYEVTYAYLLAETIFLDFFYPASICLLAIIFALIFQLFQQPIHGVQRHRGILWLHYALCGVLFLLFITIFGLQVRALYTEVFDGEATVYLVNDKPVQFVLDVVFGALCASASGEILVASILLVITRKYYQINGRIPLLALTLIAFPLFISRFYILGYDVAYKLELADFNYIVGTSVAKIVISGLAFVLIFAGLVVISMQGEHRNVSFDMEDRGLQQGGFAPSHAPPSQEPNLYDLPDKGNVAVRDNRSIGWMDRIYDLTPSFRKGGKSGLGLKTAF